MGLLRPLDEWHLFNRAKETPNYVVYLTNLPRLTLFSLRACLVIGEQILQWKKSTQGLGQSLPTTLIPATLNFVWIGKRNFFSESVLVCFRLMTLVWSNDI